MLEMSFLENGKYQSKAGSQTPEVRFRPLRNLAFCTCLVCMTVPFREKGRHLDCNVAV